MKFKLICKLIHDPVSGKRKLKQKNQIQQTYICSFRTSADCNNNKGSSPRCTHNKHKNSKKRMHTFFQYMAPFYMRVVNVFLQEEKHSTIASPTVLIFWIFWNSAQHSQLSLVLHRNGYRFNLLNSPASCKTTPTNATTFFLRQNHVQTGFSSLRIFVSPAKKKIIPLGISPVQVEQKFGSFIGLHRDGGWEKVTKMSVIGHDNHITQNWSCPWRIPSTSHLQLHPSLIVCQQTLVKVNGFHCIPCNDVFALWDWLTSTWKLHCHCLCNILYARLTRVQSMTPILHRLPKLFNFQCQALK